MLNLLLQLRGRWCIFTIYFVIGHLLFLFRQKTILFLLLLLVAFLYVLYVKNQKILIASTIFILLGLFHMYAIESKNHSHLPKDVLHLPSINMQVELLQTPKIDGDFLSSKGQVYGKEKLMIHYSVSTLEEKSILSSFGYGDECLVSGHFEAPEAARNPYSFDYKDYLGQQSIFYIFKVHDFKSCISKVSFMKVFSNIRKEGVRKIDLYFQNDSSHIAKALIFGEKSTFPSELYYLYQKLGINHLLAISGLHVVSIVGGYFLILRRIGVPIIWIEYSLFVILPIYILLTGASPSVLRASLFFLLLLLFRNLKRFLSPVDSLALLCFLLVLTNPYFLHNIGFQLSFYISTVLLLSIPILKQFSSNVFKVTLLSSCICQISSAPFLLLFNYEISSVSILINLLFIPLYTFIILPLCLFSFVLCLFFPSFSFPFTFLLETLIDVSNIFVEKISSIHWLTIQFGRISSVLFLIILVTTLYFFICLHLKKFRWKSFMVLLLLYSFAYFQPYLNPNGQITFLDVGQGDCIIIELPYRKLVLMIDTGGNWSSQEWNESWKVKQDQFEVGKDIVVPYLKARGIRTINGIFLTHGDMDHMGGAFSIVDQCNVELFFLGKKQAFSILETELEKLIGHKKIKFLKEGDKLILKNLEIFVLNPSENVQSESSNEQSIVIYTKLGGLTWLFTGDLEKEGEERLVGQYTNLYVDVLKVAHHGSKTSTTSNFLEFVKPSYAIIMAGKTNRYGHPHQEVIARLTKANVKVYETNKQGAIIFKYKDGEGTFLPYLP